MAQIDYPPHLKPMKIPFKLMFINWLILIFFIYAYEPGTIRFVDDLFVWVQQTWPNFKRWVAVSKYGVGWTYAFPFNLMICMLIVLKIIREFDLEERKFTYCRAITLKPKAKKIATYSLFLWLMFFYLGAFFMPSHMATGTNLENDFLTQGLFGVLLLSSLLNISVFVMGAISSGLYVGFRYKLSGDVIEEVLNGNRAS